METKQLFIPCSFEERKPLLLDKVLYIPKSYDHHTRPYSKLVDLFPGYQKIAIEYCSGNGDWIAAQALMRQDTVFIAVERRFDRAKKIFNRIQKHPLNNLFLVLGEGESFTQSYVEEGVIDEIFVNFPDPWPKRRHAKNRIMQRGFIDGVVKLLKVGGSLTFTTDSLPYVTSTLPLFTPQYWEPAFPHPHYVRDFEGFGTSFFSELFEKKGFATNYVRFFKRIYEPTC